MHLKSGWRPNDNANCLDAQLPRSFFSRSLENEDGFEDDRSWLLTPTSSQIHPFNPFRDTSQNLPGNRTGLFRNFGRKNFFGALAANEYGLFTFGHTVEVRYINHDLIHGDSPQKTASSASYQHVGIMARQVPRNAVSVPGAEGCHFRRARCDVRPTIADISASPQRSHEANSRFQGHCRLHPFLEFFNR
jgi:hypothetical protein